MNIISGGATIAGIVLAPFSGELSLNLTGGSIAGAGIIINIIADLAKDTNIRYDIKKIEPALKDSSVRKELSMSCYSKCRTILTG